MIGFLGALDYLGVKSSVFKEYLNLIHDHCDGVVSRSQMRHRVRDLVRQDIRLEKFTPFLKLSEMSLIPTQTHPGVPLDTAPVLYPNHLILTGDRAMNALPLCNLSYSNACLSTGKSILKQEELSHELYDAYRRAASTSFRTDLEDAKIAGKMTTYDLTVAMSRLEASTELLFRLFQDTGRDKLKPLRMVTQLDLLHLDDRWDPKVFWGQAKVAQQGKRFKAVRFRSTNTCIVLTPSDFSMACASSINLMTVHLGACITAAESALCHQEEAAVSSCYPSSTTASADPWSGLPGGVAALNDEYAKYIFEYTTGGDPSHRWEVAHVGKTGLLCSILSLPEEDLGIRHAMTSRKEEILKSIRAKRGQAFLFYSKMLSLARTICPFAALQAIRWHRAVPGAQYSAQSLAEKCRLQCQVPAVHSQEHNWDDATGAQQLKRVARAFSLVTLRAIERRVVTTAMRRARSARPDPHDEVALEQHLKVTGDFGALGELESLPTEPHPEERTYKTNYSSDVTVPMAARAGVTIPALPFVQTRSGGPVSPLPTDARIEEYVNGDTLDDVVSSKVPAAVSAFWEYEVKPVAAVTDGTTMASRKRGLELKAFTDPDYQPMKPADGSASRSKRYCTSDLRGPTAVMAAGKDEAAKSQGYQEQVLVHKLGQCNLGVADIPGMRAPMSLSCTAKFLQATESHATFWALKLLGSVTPAASGAAKAARSRARYSILIERSARMMRLGLDFASWSVGQARQAWSAGYDTISHFCSGCDSTDAIVYSGATVSCGPPGAETTFGYSDGYPQGIHLGQDSALGIGATTLASAELAADGSSGMLCPITHADQYIDDSDASMPIAHRADPGAVMEDFCRKIEELLRSSVDVVKSGVGGDSGMMIGTIEYRGLMIDEVLKLHCSLMIPIGPDDDPGLLALTAVPSISAAYLAAQATPLLAHTMGYLWTRINAFSLLKAHNVWGKVSVNSSPSARDLMLFLSTPSALGGMSVFSDIVARGSACPDKMSAFVGSAMLSADEGTRKTVQNLILKGTSLQLFNLVGDSPDPTVRDLSEYGGEVSATLKKVSDSSSQPGQSTEAAPRGQPREAATSHTAIRSRRATSRATTSQSPNPRVETFAHIAGKTNEKAEDLSDCDISVVKSSLMAAVGRGSPFDKVMSRHSRRTGDTIYGQVVACLGTHGARKLFNSPTCEEARVIAGTADFNAYSDCISQLTARRSKSRWMACFASFLHRG